VKRKGSLIELICDYDNLLISFLKAKRGKQLSAIEYESHLDKNLNLLSSQIRSGQVDVGNYHYFKIYDPKERLICAAPFSERVLHHALMRICHSYFERHLIFDTYATRPGKGTFAALERARFFSSKYAFYAKMDVKKYFDSISHIILKEQLSKLFKDKVLLSIFFQIIDSYHTKPGYGLPIGNLSSQYFANHFLSRADHYAYEVLKVDGYVRYMDDMLIFGDDIKDLLVKSKKFSDFISNQAGLCLKPIQLQNKAHGLPFLGFRLYGRRIRLSRRSSVRYRQKLRLFLQYVQTNKWTQSDFQRHFLPLISFVRHSDSLAFRKKCIFASVSLP
jgi:hypothetical protein